MSQSEEQLNREYPLAFKVAGAVITAAFVIVVSLSVLDEKERTPVRLNLIADVISFASIGYILNLLAKAREEEQLKAQLVRELNASSDIARRALEELRAKGWLKDGSLKGAFVPRACLDGVELTGAKLEKVQLPNANLIEADLRFVNFRGAKLGCAVISKAKLWRADLSEASLFNAALDGATLMHAQLIQADLCHANLCDAKLENADLRSAKLHWANFARANLKGANLEGIEYVSCILPDETTSVNPADLLRFTK